MFLLFLLKESNNINNKFLEFRERYMRVSLYLLFIIIVGFNCATQQKAVVENEPEEEAADSVVEGFEPLSMLKDDVEIPPPTFEIKKIDYKDLLPTDLRMLDSVSISIDEMAPGFRVQIGLFQKVTFAIEKRERAYSIFEEEVYMDFAAPFHRVKVGDCLTRKDAMTLLQKVRKNGFPDAFITPTRVYKYPELRRQKREAEKSKADSLYIKETNKP